MRVINTLTGVLLIAVVGLHCLDEAKEMSQEMLKYALECSKEMNITEEEEQRLKTDKKFAEMRMRCFSACLMKKSEEIGEDGKPNLERISQIEHALHPRKAEEVMKVISQCLDEVESVEDECDFANAYDECVNKNASEISKHERIP